MLFRNYNLSTIHIELLTNIIDSYKQIASKTSNNYAGKMIEM